MVAKKQPEHESYYCTQYNDSDEPRVLLIQETEDDPLVCVMDLAIHRLKLHLHKSFLLNDGHEDVVAHDCPIGADDCVQAQEAQEILVVV